MTQHHIEHDPRDPLAFTPVPHAAKRHDGWTPRRQREFIETLAQIGSVKGAAKAVGLQPCGAYKLRNKAGGESFAVAWDAAVYRGTQAVRDVMVDHALNGVPDPIFHGGKKVGERRRFNLRGQQWLVENGDAAIERARKRAIREDPHVVRARITETVQKICDAEIRTLYEKLDTDEKRHAFNLLWGSLDEDPFALGSKPNVNSWAKVHVAHGLIGGARLVPEEVEAETDAPSA